MPAKTLLSWLLLIFGMLLASNGQAQAQPCPVTPNAPACTFRAIDVATGTPSAKLCVGRAVRFEYCSNRDPALTYTYLVNNGSGVLPNPCGPFLPATTTYTPTAAGFVTVTENASSSRPGVLPTIYFITFQVYDSPAPAFTLAACAPGSVQVTLPSAPYDSYTVQIGTGAPVAAASGQVVTYPVPTGATSVTVVGRYNDNSLCTNSATQPLAQLAPLGPLAIQRVALSGTTTQLDVAPLTTGYRYTVERADASNVYQTVPAAVQTSTTSFTVPSTTPSRYRLRATDVCGNSFPPSAAVSTLSLAATPAERRNELSWQLFDNPVSYELTRDNTPLAAPLAPSARTYTDTSVACGVQYTYRLTARYAGGVSSVSDVVSVRATATQPPATPRLFATFDLRNRVQLTASVARFPATGQLTYLTGGRILAATTSRTLTDSTTTRFVPGTGPCYQARFVDDCANRSADSAPFCPAVLAAELADSRGSSVRLTWSGLRGAPTTDTLSYRLLVLDAGNAVLRSVSVSKQTTYLDLTPPDTQQQVRYRLEVRGGGLPGSSYSNIATATRRLEAYVPTAFTPNGDGLNDVLEVKGRFLKTFRFVIVDRNGQEVFRGTNRSQTWDGRVRNEPPVPGAFVWRFEAVDDAGQTVVQHGTVTILK
ncbi:gliding motility-associated C-terminal domain-containing protein [Hymenobacter sp. BT186]|uniref:Gliding motility-associated C-terminal domain-containing protein n=1 Tax=Hymenobacter telluris TaxID=2816474 RepID=A0A939ETL9_9BACT|nr:gliding motility-associated C-terminal domain-containing protein [Hymenobacter telluris]MBO0356736.1 gliding motility-associated C-terminal domain-containing protein [Hymenobacter telluris]MBW3372761.1 gliding motility-associated C-terminal domain-containing protein [Hymenobacter norwichensis]